MTRKDHFGKFKLLLAFENLFRGSPYLHRNSSLGNFVAIHLYEDLYEGRYSPKFNRGVEEKTCVVNVGGSTRGVKARRGDGTFGKVVPMRSPVGMRDFRVLRGMVALTQIGVEVKIAAKSRLKQIDRVLNDLVSSARTLKEKSRNAITVGFAAVNFSFSVRMVEPARSRG